jgi:hypothetical protein
MLKWYFQLIQDEFKNKDKTDEQDINVHNEAISDVQRKIHVLW